MYKPLRKPPSPLAHCPNCLQTEHQILRNGHPASCPSNYKPLKPKHLRTTAQQQAFDRAYIAQCEEEELAFARKHYVLPEGYDAPVPVAQDRL